MMNRRMASGGQLDARPSTDKSNSSARPRGRLTPWRFSTWSEAIAGFRNHEHAATLAAGPGARRLLLRGCGRPERQRRPRGCVGDETGARGRTGPRSLVALDVGEDSWQAFIEHLAPDAAQQTRHDLPADPREPRCASRSSGRRRREVQRDRSPRSVARPPRLARSSAAAPGLEPRAPRSARFRPIRARACLSIASPAASRPAPLNGRPAARGVGSAWLTGWAGSSPDRANHTRDRAADHVGTAARACFMGHPHRA